MISVWLYAPVGGADVLDIDLVSGISQVYLARAPGQKAVPTRYRNRRNSLAVAVYSSIPATAAEQDSQMVSC